MTSSYFSYDVRMITSLRLLRSADTLYTQMNYFNFEPNYELKLIRNALISQLLKTQLRNFEMAKPTFYGITYPNYRWTQVYAKLR